MKPALLMIAAGMGFVLLGRWLYKNPRRLVPVWGIFNRDNPGVQKLARAYATFLIFFGMLALSGTIAVLLLPSWSVVIAGLALAVAGTWLVRRQLLQPKLNPADPAALTSTEQAKEAGLFSKHWKRNLGILSGFTVVLLGVLFGLLGSSDVSKMAFAAAQASPMVTERLGQPIKKGFFSSGTIQVSGPSGRADIAIPISGPKGKATLYLVAQKSADQWKFETLQVSFNEGGERIDLLKGGESSQR